MKLYVLRHGIAVEPGSPGYENDSTRPLTPEGKRALRHVAAFLRKKEVRFDRILSSPFRRARQTAEIVAGNLKQEKRLAFSVALTPDGDVDVLIRQLNATKPVPEHVLLVGHEPYLSRFVSLLVSGNSGADIQLKKGGLCKLDADTLHAGHCARLLWLLTPGQMKMMN